MRFVIINNEVSKNEAEWLFEGALFTKFEESARFLEISQDGMD